MRRGAPDVCARGAAYGRSNVMAEARTLRMGSMTEHAAVRGVRTATSDNYRGEAPEFERAPKAELNFPGIGTLLSIEGLVELGMTPSQAMGMKEGSVIDVSRLRLQPPCPNSCPR